MNVSPEPVRGVQHGFCAMCLAAPTLTPCMRPQAVPVLDMTLPEPEAAEILKQACETTGFFYRAPPPPSLPPSTLSSPAIRLPVGSRTWVNQPDWTDMYWLMQSATTDWRTSSRSSSSSHGSSSSSRSSSNMRSTSRTRASTGAVLAPLCSR